MPLTHPHRKGSPFRPFSHGMSCLDFNVKVFHGVIAPSLPYRLDKDATQGSPDLMPKRQL
jgi:hypothetical protein